MNRQAIDWKHIRKTYILTKDFLADKLESEFINIMGKTNTKSAAGFHIIAINV